MLKLRPLFLPASGMVEFPVRPSGRGELPGVSWERDEQQLVSPRVALFGLAPSAPFLQPLGKLMVVIGRNREPVWNPTTHEGYVEQKKTDAPFHRRIRRPVLASRSASSKLPKRFLAPIAPSSNLICPSSPSEELVGALHQVRDKVLEGTVPLVFWTSRCPRVQMATISSRADAGRQVSADRLPILSANVSSSLRRHQLYHGKLPPSAENKDSYAKFKLVKGPDFISRLNGYLNVLGPNRATFRQS